MISSALDLARALASKGCPLSRFQRATHPATSGNIPSTLNEETFLMARLMTSFGRSDRDEKEDVNRRQRAGENPSFGHCMVPILRHHVGVGVDDVAIMTHENSLSAISSTLSDQCNITLHHYTFSKRFHPGLIYPRELSAGRIGPWSAPTSIGLSFFCYIAHRPILRSHFEHASHNHPL